MRLTVQLSGVDTLSLRTKPFIEAARNGARFGVSEAVQLLVDEARLNVPVLTGHLRDSIHAEVVDANPDRYAMAVSPAVEAGNKWGIDPAYARAVEYGYLGMNSAGRMQNTPAQPYMRPAGDVMQGEARQRVVDSIYSELDSAMAGRRA